MLPLFATPGSTRAAEPGPSRDPDGKGIDRLMQVDAIEVIGRYAPVLIAAAAILALTLSQSVLIFTDRVCRTSGITGWWWLAVSSVMIGLAIWSVDLLHRLALLPGPSYRFAVGYWALGATIAVLASASWLALQKLRWPLALRAVAAAALTAPALAAMHLLVLAAVGSPVASDGWRSILIALAIIGVTSGALFLIAARFSSATDARPWLATLSALLAVSLLATGVYLEILYPTATWGDDLPRSGGLVVNRESVVAWAVVVLIALVAVAIAAHLDRRVRRQHAETVALRRSEDRFRSLVQASAQIVWTTTPAGEMRGEQPGWTEFTGQDRESYSGAGWFNAIHPDDREATARIWEETLGARTSAELEHRLRRHDGHYRRCVVRVVPVLDRDGSVREWVGTHTDISERSRIQDERDLLSEVGKVLSSSLDYTETLATVGRLLVPQMATWCAVDVRDDDGRLQRVATANDDARVAELLAPLNIGEAAEPARAITRRVTEDGESVLLRRASEDILGTIARDPGHRAALEGVGLKSLLWVPLSSRGQVLGVMTLASARTGRTYDLRDLALTEELARRSANAVDNARLYARAREAVRARDDVLGMVSHDLRNPIATIAMTSDLMLDLDMSPDEQRKHLEIIRRAVKGMNRFIQDLLDVSQTEQGQLAIETHRVSPGALVNEACDLMRPLVAAESQRLECHVDPDLPDVEADPSRIQQVLSNLLGNSIKFAGTEGVIRIEVRGHPEGARFAVMDNGPGIAPEAIPRLFDRHWRARETAHLGAGLGLAIAKGIVEAHGGRIWVESQLGEGTAFFFVIPALTTGGDALETAPAAAPERAAGKTEGESAEQTAGPTTPRTRGDSPSPRPPSGTPRLAEAEQGTSPPMRPARTASTSAPEKAPAEPA
jgi:PAS domain S-box-containing protein